MASRFTIEQEYVDDHGDIGFRLHFDWATDRFKVEAKSFDALLAMLYAAGCNPDPKKEGVLWCDWPRELREALDGIRENIDDAAYLQAVRDDADLPADEFSDAEVAWMDWQLRDWIAEEARVSDHPWHHTVKVDPSELAKRVIKTVEQRKHRWKGATM